jgi:hypothetical protein
MTDRGLVERESAEDKTGRDAGLIFGWPKTYSREILEQIPPPVNLRCSSDPSDSCADQPVELTPRKDLDVLISWGKINMEWIITNIHVSRSCFPRMVNLPGANGLFIIYKYILTKYKFGFIDYNTNN